MILTVRLLPFAAADGATNMAADEAMLESAAEGTASLQFYTWAEPTLSLGYFQPHVVRSLRERIGGEPLAERTDYTLATLPWVRRSTGGAAIVHHRELTYALALPAGKAWLGTENWICRFHHLLQAVLSDAGVTSRGVVCGEEQTLGEVLCFLHQTPGDLTIDGAKVAGSAQRKRMGALLQHGSLLLWRSEFAPQLAGMCDFAGREVFTPAELAERLTQRFAADTGWKVEPGDWTEAERARIPEIRTEKYANPAWNAKR